MEQVNRSSALLRSPAFMQLCLSAGLFMASFNMIIPELPDYLSARGGASYKGFIIGLFAATALLSRPFSGKLTDRIGRRPVMIFGAVVAAACSLGYPFVHGLGAFFALRMLHGLSAGFKPTGDTAMLADIVDRRQRGEALGYLGLCSSAGMAAGPALGSLIALHFGLELMFYVSSLLALLSLVVVYRMGETGTSAKLRLQHFALRRDDLLESSVLWPAVIMLLTVYSFGMALTLIPDFSELLGMANKGLYFTVMLVASIATRLFSGKASDRYGRVSLMRTGTLVLAVGMLVTAAAQSIVLFLCGGIIFGIAAGINSPTVFAWTVDLAHEERRGRALSTLYIALELGVLLGAFGSAALYANQASRMPWAFISGAALAVLAHVLLWVGPKKNLTF